MRFLLCVILLAASWQPAAAQSIGRAAASSARSAATVPAFSPSSVALSPSWSMGARLEASPLSGALPSLRAVIPSIGLPNAPGPAQAVPAAFLLPGKAGRLGVGPRTGPLSPLLPLGRTQDPALPLSAAHPALAPQTPPVRGVPVLRRLAALTAPKGIPLESGLDALFDGAAAGGTGLSGVRAETSPSASPAGLSPASKFSPGRAGTPAPAPSDGEGRFGFLKKPSVGKALAATASFKVSMEALAITVPLLALEVFGSATWLATMAVAWGSMMTLSSLLAGGRLDRTSVSRVLSGALLAQAVLVGVMAGLFITGTATPWNILPLHALSGAAMGVILTGRDTLPSRLLGRDLGMLGKFNSTVHLVYEVAGTIAPLLIGLLITGPGLKYALLLHPPAALLAAVMFFTVKLLPPSARAAPAAKKPHQPLLRRIVSDVKQGSRFFTQSPAFAWLGFMLLMPMVVHRVFEQMVVPVFVKLVLHAPQASAWIVSSSNFGELLGALLLLKYMLEPAGKKGKSAFRFMRLMALGTLAVWSLTMSGSLWLIIPLVFLMSLSWAANDLSMTAFFQSKLPEESAGKAIGFLMAAELGVIMLLNYLLGVMFDFVPVMWGVLAVNIACTVLAYFFWKGKSKLKAISDSGGLPPAGGPPPSAG